MKAAKLPVSKSAKSHLEVVAELIAAAAKMENSQETYSVQVEHEGTKIKLPALPSPMSPGEAAEHLNRLQELEETQVTITERVHTFPMDGAVAFMRAMQHKFGWATPMPGGWFMRPPETIGVEIGVGKTITVLWGRFTIPGFDDDSYLACGSDRTEDGEFVFCIRGSVKQKERGLVAELADLTRKFTLEQSIYKGQALRIRMKPDGTFDASASPAFIEINRRDPLILPPVVDSAVRANLFTPVERSADCRRAGIPLKRGIVLAGEPGTGKTLTAQELASRCVKHGWTYLLLPNLKALPHVIQFAKRYAPAVIFCEDIDHGTSGARDAAMNELLNTMDGINTKTAEVMLVFTTNNHTTIERTLVRPGRIDAIIEFPTPRDEHTISRFIRHYGNACIDPTEDLTQSCAALYGALPAVIREAVERAKLYALSREGVSPENLKITDVDIFTAVETMKNHINFLDSKRDRVKSPAEILGEAFINAVGAAEVESRIDATSKRIEENTVIIKEAVA
jgi:transitional endoplasmic reticulum ATPase